jgi:hypothetical protein
MLFIAGSLCFHPEKVLKDSRENEAQKEEFTRFLPLSIEIQIRID